MIKRLFGLLSLLFLSIDGVYAGSIQIADAQAYIHADGVLVSQVGIGSTGYFSTLDSNNLGTFGWAFTNTTGSTLSNVHFFGFLDADIDRDLNTFFNEYGEFVDLSLPASAPGGVSHGPAPFSAEFRLPELRSEVPRTRFS